MTSLQNGIRVSCPCGKNEDWFSTTADSVGDITIKCFECKKVYKVKIRAGQIDIKPKRRKTK